MSTTVRISNTTKDLLCSIAHEQQLSLQETLDQAVKHYRNQLLLEITNARYKVLRANKKDWNEELREREDWDNTLLDNLE